MKRPLKDLVKRGVEQATARGDSPIEKIMLSATGYSRQPTDPQIDHLASAVTNALKPLLGVAMSGNVHAIRRLTEAASRLCSEAMLLACMHQDAANQVARERTTWPLNISPDPAERRRALRLVTGPRRLPLSKGTGKQEPAVRKSYSFASPANQAVLVAMKAIQVERSFRIPSELFPVLQPEWSVAAAQLPDLDGTAAVADRWFQVIWSCVCHRHGGEPENSPLRKLAEATPHSNEPVRSRIRHSLRLSFDRLVRKRRR